MRGWGDRFLLNLPLRISNTTQCSAPGEGLFCMVLEKEKIANTIETFPKCKCVYAEPDTAPPKGKLWLESWTSS